ncbi:AfsR/SARP family transcriptional regulator [Saccharothrix sp. NRRL B-16314]|uniref:AfsR/SARP family transcriptional regulator n=1 Tax=Saccharothrix sp. NRRL B-16314 TaxID=1463825 RepID=UPI000524B53B|nr:BTAD domain-containing putative transcriptional regulator [Saccharothrix sp. NRRL B-16314]
MIGFEVLGELRVSVDDREVPVPAGLCRVLLAALLLRAGEVVPADRLVDWLWDGAPPNPARAKATLQMTVTRLRQALGDANVIRTAEAGYVADVPPGSLDLHRYRALVDEGRYADALAVWRGDPLPDVRSDTLHGEEVAPLLEHRLDVLAQRVDVDLDAGRAREVVAELRVLTRRHPLREKFWAQLMLALYRSDRQAEALAVYEEVRTYLADELGADPGPALRGLHQRILEHGSAGSAPRDGVPRQLPAPPRVFIGRRQALVDLDAAVPDPAAESGSAVVISAINGTAGIGKTALAVHWAHRVAHRFPDGQLYTNLRGFDPSGQPASPTDVLRGFLEALDVPPGRIPQTVDAQASLYRSLLADRSVLVVLDNARDADQVRPLLPGTPGCLVVVTSRSRLTGLVVQEGARPVPLDLMDRDEAVALLEAGVGKARSTADPRSVDRLVTWCGGLPLALAVVAARTAVEPAASLRAFAAEPAADRSRLDALDTGDRSTSVRDVFSWSYKYLSDPAARVFRLLGLHPGPDISPATTASLAALPFAEARRALVELAHANLISEHTPGRYAVHDLLRSYAADQADAEHTAAEIHEARGRLLDHIAHTAEQADKVVFPQREPVALPPARPGVGPEPAESHAAAMAWYRTELCTLLAATHYAAEHGFDAHAWLIPRFMAAFCHASGHWPEWVEVCREGLGAAERLGDVRGRADMHRGLGRAASLLHRWDEAEDHLNAALDLFREAGDRVSEAYALVNLSACYELRGIPAESLPRQLRALELFRELGHVHGQARALTSSGYSYLLLGRYEEAVRFAADAIGLYEHLTDMPGHAAATENLGMAYRELGRLEEALTVQRKAVELFARSGDRYYEAGSWRELGETHRRAGDLDAARAALRNALTAFEELHHPHADEVRRELEGLR